MTPNLQTGSSAQGAACRVISIILMLCFFMAAAAPAAAKKKKDKVEEGKEKLHNIHREIRKTKTILRQIKQKEKTLTSEVYKTEIQLSETKQKLEQVASALRKTQLQKEVASNNLKKTKQKFEKEKNEFEKRLVQIYKYGTLRQWEVLLGAADFWDFLTRVRFLRSIIVSDVDLLERIENTKNKIARQENLLKKKVKKETQLKIEVGEQKKQYAYQYTKKSELLKDMREKKGAYEQYLAELEQTSNEIASWLRKIEAEQRKKPKHYTYSFKGKWLRPVPGKITSPYGYRRHPIFKISKLHTGVDFGASYGSPIHAAAGGIVYYSGWWGGYGNVVILDHGGGIATVYAHCSGFAVSKGQSVKPGQVIAYVGSTGLSTGPHLHFEVRKNGSPVNPLR